MMKKTTLVCGLLLALFLPALGGHGAEPKKTEPLMQRKLIHAQKVLEGLALNDCDKVATNAEELLTISQLNEWKALKTPRYATYSDEFQENVNKLIKSAKDKDLDADYISEMKDDHEDAVKLFEKASKSEDPDIAAFAMKTLPKLQHHLEMVKTLKSTTK